MDKPIVSTLDSSYVQKRKKIAAYLLEHPEGCTPKMISLGTSINVNTVKSILPKLNNVRPFVRGFYKVDNTGDTPSASTGDLSAWNFHNLVLSIQLKSFQFHSNVVKLDLMDIAVNINSSGYCTIRLSTDYPVNVSSIGLLFGWLKLYLKDYSSDELSSKDIQVSTIEFNQDYSNLKLDGVNCITLDSLNEQFKIYQKSIGLRIEHKTKAKFNVDNMIDMLTGSATAVDLSNRMTEHIDKLNKLTGQTIYNTQLLNKLLEVSRK